MFSRRRNVIWKMHSLLSGWGGGRNPGRLSGWSFCVPKSPVQRCWPGGVPAPDGPRPSLTGPLTRCTLTSSSRTGILVSLFCFWDRSHPPDHRQAVKVTVPLTLPSSRPCIQPRPGQVKCAHSFMPRPGSLPPLPFVSCSPHSSHGRF